MFRRPLRRAIIRPNNPAIVQAVSRANQLLANGKPGDAAEIFARLAEGGDDRARASPGTCTLTPQTHTQKQKKNLLR